MSELFLNRYKLISLADYPQYIDTCAAWHFTAWGVKSDQRTLKKDIKKFQVSTEKNKVPFTVIFMDTVKNVPVAMGSVWDKDSDYWSTISPWITGIFVHEDYRNQGLAHEIMKVLEKELIRMNIQNIYLTASAAINFYKKLNYTEVETRDAPETPTGKQTLFKKELL
tara:strand:- start:1873 stop:2373 length:501 start_codon:yes stop_codon:yes gene_type:complete